MALGLVIKEFRRLMAERNAADAELAEELRKLIITSRDLRYLISINYESQKMKTLLKKIDQNIVNARDANLAMLRLGSVRVARISGRYKPAPEAPGFITVNVTSVNTKSVGAELSPFKLRTEQGCILENVWQFSKFYDVVDGMESAEPDGWSWPMEQHAEAGNPNEAYWLWREAGYNFQHPVRRPVPKGKKPLCAIWNNERLGYIDARKQIYIPVYTALARQTEDFAILRMLLVAGYNLQILDFDGPPTEITESEYKVLDKINYFNLSGTMLVDSTNWEDLVNSEALILGHGFVLARALQT